MTIEKINGVQLRYELSGAGNVPLVLVHGSWGSHLNWDAVVPALRESFRVLTYDRRGHADSECPSGQGSVLDDVADLAALIESLDLAPAFVIGNSFGSSIALRLAGERPDLFRGLIVHEPPIFSVLVGEPDAAPLLGSMGESMGAVVEQIAAGNHAEATEAFMKMALAPGEWSQLPDTFKRIAVECAPTFLDEAKDPEALNFDLAWIKDFKRPALLTRGADSPPQYAPALLRVEQTLPHCETLTFSDMGHLPHVTHPVAYVEAITRFIREHSA